MSLISQSLLITAIGMGLVFILIILLWGFMVGLVSISNRWDFMAAPEVGVAEAGEEKPEIIKQGVDNAGIVAVAVATLLATGQRLLHITPMHSGGISNWQAVTRANTLASISSIFNRKPRG
jgi:Na+-transporting methylmalonyl-CoA/oxaloacetate decarboxylase gamma subunit